MSKKIYVVTSGEYSDYRIEAMFTSKRVAEKFADNGTDFDAAEVETYTLNEGADKIRQGLKHFNLEMDRDGTALFIGNRLPSAHVRTRILAAYTYGDTYKPRRLEMSVWAKDKNHAAKIANEKRTLLIANNEWGEEAE